MSIYVSLDRAQSKEQEESSILASSVEKEAPPCYLDDMSPSSSSGFGPGSFGAPSGSGNGTSISDRELAQAVDNALMDLLLFDPVQSTSVGHHAHDGAFADLSAAGRRARRRALSGHAHALEGRIGVDPEIELDRRLLLDELRVVLRTEEDIDPARRNPAIYAEEVLNGINLLLMRPPLQSRLGALLGRLREVSRVLTQAREELCAAEVPRIWAEIGIAVARAGLPLLAEAVPQAVQQALGDTPLGAAVSAAAGEAALCLGDFANFVEERILPRAEGEFAAGDSYFTFLLHHKHGISQSPEDLFHLGQKEVERLEVALSETARRLRPAGGSSWPWLQVMQELELEGRISPSALVPLCNEFCATARAAVAERICPLPEDERLDIVETPEFARPTTPFAAYWPPPPLSPESGDELRGVFWITPGSKVSRGELYLTCLHEGYPGHHLQFCHAARTGSRTRRVIGTPVFWEGWALYCESICSEIGGGQPGLWGHGDDELQMYVLRGQLWRAYRVMIDVGLHCRGMSVNQAVDLLQKGVGFTREEAESEVRRYTGSPTYPLTYLLGYHAFRRLRDEAERRVGSAFSAPAFHERLLSHGSIPLGYLHERLGPKRHPEP